VVLLTDSERLAAHRAESVELLASTGYEVTSVAYSTAQLFLQRLAELTVDLILVEVRAWTFKSTCPGLIGDGEAGRQAPPDSAKRFHSPQERAFFELVEFASFQAVVNTTAVVGESETRAKLGCSVLTHWLLPLSSAPQ